MKGHRFFVAGVAVLFLFAALPVYADTISLYVTGTVTNWTESCGTNLSGVGSTWTGLATFDDSRTTSDPAIRRNPGEDSLTLTINDFGWGVLLGTMDVRYPDPYNQGDDDYPEMVFPVDTLVCVDMNYEYNYGSEYVFTIGGTNLGNMKWKISAFNGDTHLISGDLEVSEVPIPGAIWLLGSGLGLVGLGRRFRGA